VETGTIQTSNPEDEPNHDGLSKVLLFSLSFCISNRLLRNVGYKKEGSVRV
jgi:hypothetical protein